MAETYSTFLRRGLVAGFVGGIAGALALWVLGEPSIRDALELEDRLSGGEQHEDTFSRGVQVLGGVAAVLITGVVLALVFTIVFVKLRGRLALRTEAHLAVVVGALGFLVHGVIPWLKYPPNPPGVGDPDTVDQRTLSYITLLVVAVAAMLAAHDVAARLARRGVDQPLRWVSATAMVLAVVGLSYVVLPDPDPVPRAIRADLLWRFRLASLGGLAALWGAMSLTMAVLCRSVISLRPRDAASA
jgi:Probable cobalt transporter subunit (CbtA)